MAFADPFGLDSIAAAEVTQSAENALDHVVTTYDTDGTQSKQCNRGVNYGFKDITGSTELEDEDGNALLANDMIDVMEESDNFETVDLDDVQEQLDDGEVIIAGKKEDDGESGHVALGVPGGEEPSGNWGGSAPVGMDTGKDKRWSKKGMNYSWTSKTGVKFYKYVGPSYKTYNVGKIKGATITANGNKKATPIQIVIKSTN
jgi:hypothetical protein